MSAPFTERPPADVPHAELLNAITAAKAALDFGPNAMSIRRDRTGRTAALTFANPDQLVAWAAWLHWPWASNAKDGEIVFQAFGELAGYTCRLVAAEPLVPEAAPTQPAADPVPSAG